jgi:hypothetical protein
MKGRQGVPESRVQEKRPFRGGKIFPRKEKKSFRTLVSAKNHRYTLPVRSGGEKQPLQIRLGMFGDKNTLNGRQ